MNYAVEMGSDAMILHARFNKDWFRHSEVARGGRTDSKVIS
jgi:hypothetical protein